MLSLIYNTILFVSLFFIYMITIFFLFSYLFVAIGLSVGVNFQAISKFDKYTIIGALIIPLILFIIMIYIFNSFISYLY